MSCHAFAENAIGRGLHKESFVASCSVVSRRSWAKEQANQAAISILAASLDRLTLTSLPLKLTSLHLTCIEGRRAAAGVSICACNPGVRLPVGCKPATGAAGAGGAPNLTWT